MKRRHEDKHERSLIEDKEACILTREMPSPSCDKFWWNGLKYSEYNIFWEAKHDRVTHAPSIVKK